VRVLVVNAGSSTVKLSLLGPGDETLAERELPAPQSRIDPAQLREALDEGLGEADAVGHRIVHGAAQFRDPVRIDASVEAALRGLVDLAPLHQPKSLAALDAVSAALPGLPAVACFDTAFHSTLPPAAATYALPAAWAGRWGVRRYGFHGLSHAWVAHRAPEMLGVPGSGSGSGAARIVSCHLGAGASLCAIAGGHSIDTTMGFTPLEGLVMATRSGNVDPGLLLWLLEREALTTAELGDALEHESGLLGLAGTADMREVLARVARGDEVAGLALEVYVHRLRAGIAAMTAALAGIDVLVFTGGVGERSPEIRGRAADGLAYLGVTVDGGLNAGAMGDVEITGSGASVRTVVLHAREDVQIAHETRQVLAK